MIWNEYAMAHPITNASPTAIVNPSVIQSIHNPIRAVATPSHVILETFCLRKIIKIGTMTISRDGEVIADIDLNASSAVEKKGIGLIIKDFFATIFFGSDNDTEENSEI